MEQIETNRLIVRELTPRDSSFIFKLLNQPSWIKYIGDKGVRSIEDAEKYIRNGPISMYTRLGFGLFAVELAASAEPIGICGLIKRDELEDADLGFAFLEHFWGNGYALEAATAVMEFAKGLGFTKVVAITTLDNEASVKLLEKIDFRFDRVIRLAAGDEALRLYFWQPAGSMTDASS